MSEASARELTLLVADPDLVEQMAVARVIRGLALPVTCAWADSVEEARAALAERGVDAAVVADRLGDGGPLDLLPHLEGVPAIVLLRAADRALGEQLAKSASVHCLVRAGGDGYEPDLGATLCRLLGLPEIAPRGALAPRSPVAAPVVDARRELSEFVHLITHDLKAPLRGMATLAEMIAAEQAAALGDEGRTRLAMLRRRAERLVGLLDRVHEYGLLTRDLAWAAVELREVFAETLATLSVPAHVTLEVAQPLPRVWGDRARLALLFRHLLENAVKFLDKPRGRIRVAAAETPEGWRISVADNGPGIEGCYLETIFEPCKTLAPQDQVEGSGLGLTVAKKIVELHGGRIWAESTLGDGATFHVVLPAVPAPG